MTGVYTIYICHLVPCFQSVIVFQRLVNVF